MTKPLILYSAQTYLAYRINEKYYKQFHWVWCSPFLNPKRDGTDINQYPPSAIPGKIYANLLLEVKSKDSFHPWAEKNKVGILKGIDEKKKSNVISPVLADTLISLVSNASLDQFTPLLYVLPFSKVSKIAIEIPPGAGASPFSVEYRIPYLPRRSFDLQELPDL